ncbi:MAG: pyruvate carboxylase [Planctomycetota bacterium]|jgi:pyruvate carboxylase|nr:pyruvate carboxylase [Planctomycetia bacterium]MDO7678040.1 pyruvate carboxylase [Pirellulales bacterium]
MIRPIKKLLVANRSEIAIRVFRSAHELGIRTVAIYAHEDRFALHRFKADESYLIGRSGEPIRSYLDIAGIVSLAMAHGVDAIHPGYGFLSENPEFAAACKEAGITFVGPRVELLETLGDKTTARELARKAGVPILAGSSKPVTSVADAAKIAKELGWPVMLKAAHGGGGRGMRIVRGEDELAVALEAAQRESQTAFGSASVFVEKFIQRARHIEVQLLGDTHGGLVHLFERDCSVQRRHQKVVEVAPAPNLDPKMRTAICDAAIAIGRAARYENAGTVEFLVDTDTSRFFFIEVNPRIQVEHTVTEEITGIDIVRRQLRVAEGYKLSDNEIGLGNQDEIRSMGTALQCRVTTEDPENRFLPDYGRITAYRSASGMGIRLDAGTAFSGAVVTPYFDSLLVKVSARGLNLQEAAGHIERCLQEFRVRGVKTNIPFLINLVTHPDFQAGRCTTRFIDETPSLFDFPVRQDRATKLLEYLGDVIVNGNSLVKGRPVAVRRQSAPIPQFDPLMPPPEGTRTKLKALGPVQFAQWVRKQKTLFVTDTTMRDAHQSLLATRMRTFDMLSIADAYARLSSGLFSLEMWGGATFDTSMRFLKECPWDRLLTLRERIPNVLFQMLLRASNAVGYTNYPDNVVSEFVKESAASGIDVFRVFDPLNWVPNMRVAIDAVVDSGAVCEAAICYTGDVLDPKRTKYSLSYYVELAVELEKLGCHMLAVKDMAGLCKPFAAAKLVKALRESVGLPIHFHTHDTTSASLASALEAARAGASIVDAAMAPFAGLTSQPNLNAIVEAVRNTPLDTKLDPEPLRHIAHYWHAVRDHYTAFECGMKAPDADLYLHEMPGGQFTNLLEQARALGLADRWEEICKTYADVNDLLGDIVKVTPTSKAVGDLSLLLVTNGMQASELLSDSREMAFPESLVDLLSGRMGQPPGGFPPAIVKRVVRKGETVTGRPGESMPPADFSAATKHCTEILSRAPSHREVLSWLLYPRVFQDFALHRAKHGDVSVLPTPAFLEGPKPGEELAVDIEPGKTLVIRLLTVGESHADGTRTVFFELNGQPRSVTIADRSLEASIVRRPKAVLGDAREVGSPMPGLIVTVAVRSGDIVSQGQKLLSLEAMKMETTVYAERNGIIEEVLVIPGTPVEVGELVVRYRSA